ncbi:tripartite tricarboxylate transporter permease [Blastococcus goldschmidtiae]|uniref:Tripartite tricarboxylate transporter permease n=1 Tax=Blastococcus goldschmidtiae TaxID=3075546 RepID=A0ABU2K6W4_9ACTN|nr:tripartite tricarboxylate transporter permease [Blastococcus sp. DSM 46792]MDT0275932.1 tripartite tricarboxylate transporter permease [Blastococcus sp. DSM 46792]
MTGDLLSGFAAVFSPELFLLAVIGVVLGTLVGVLPGIGPIGAMSILLGLTTQIGATGSLILFAGIYYGAAYGGSTTSILLGLPGESASVVTAMDGHAMTKRGRAGAALSIAALGSFVAGTLSIVGLMLFAPLLSDVAVQLGPPEYLALTIAGLGMLVVLTPGAASRSALMVLVGLAIGVIGIDPLTATPRYTLGMPELSGGISFVAVVMGVFGVAEVLDQAGRRWFPPRVKAPSMRELVPTRSELRRAAPASLRGSGIGFFLGLIPGPAAIISTFASYLTERKISKRPEEFGHGAVEGVAGPESANNAAAGAAFIPLMALGIPFAPVMALILSALLLNGIVPGPTFIDDQPTLFWTVIASMYLANAMLLVLNLPLVGLFTRVLAVPPGVLMPVILGLTVIGVYADNNSVFDIGVMFVAGFAGLFFRRAGLNLAPLVLALVLAPTLETSLRQTLSLAQGDVGYVLRRPAAVAIFGIVLLVVVLRVVAMVRAHRDRGPAGAGPLVAASGPADPSSPEDGEQGPGYELSGRRSGSTSHRADDVSADRSSPGPSSPGPSTPGPSTPDSSTPGPSTPDSSTPGPSTPDSSTPNQSSPIPARTDHKE